MRTVIYGTLLTIFLVSVGTVQASNELDGKALLCGDHKGIAYGLLFDKGKVSEIMVNGHSKTFTYTKNYRVSGTKAVKWSGYQLNRETLTVQFMGLSSDQCSISSRAEIDQTLDEIIDAAKHKNKI
jgi:hypothetical protein